MLTFSAFTGINNVVNPIRLQGNDLITATNVDIGLTGEVRRRGGFTVEDDTCHKNIHDGDGFMLATTGNELVAIHPNGDRFTIHTSIGPERLWYCNLPDGRTTFTNGLIHGITDGFTGKDRSVPTPAGLGAPDDAFGSLFAGTYRYALTHIRPDGAESPAIGSEPFTITNGGLRLDGLPVLLGHKLNVYLTHKDGKLPYLAGSTLNGTFEWGGKDSDLVLDCRTLDARPVPVGTITAFWRGRVLIADGNVLWACRAHTPHLHDHKDFKQFSKPITMIQPVDDGIYVGTQEDLVWLGGDTWEGLGFRSTRRGPVVPGSGVQAPGSEVKMGDGTGGGTAMVCIAGGEIVAGFSGGQTSSLTGNRYKTTVAEVVAAFRMVPGPEGTPDIPQYIAIPQ